METNLYQNIHHVPDLNRATDKDLRLVIRTYPVVDNHAHNMLREEYAHGDQDHPFESITSEALGEALHNYTQTSLAHIQGVYQLTELFECQPTLDDVKAARNNRIRDDYPALVQQCLSGTHAILIDDGLSPDVVHPISWHKQFVPTVARIVRIESVAAELMEQLAHSAGLLNPGHDADWDIPQSEAILIRFNTMFRGQVRTLAQHSGVRGFKSVVCYRTGLDVGLESRGIFDSHPSLTASSLLSAFHVFLQKAVRMQNYRIEQKSVNDYLVVTVCDILDQLAESNGENVPIQFHTGLGDADIDLVKANPAYMQPIITAFPRVDFVLLHASYPYTKEAGYLTSAYANAWLDIGLVFPLLSRDGQESALRRALQLAPTTKILWSTDGHLHPETYYLSNRQFRAALEKVLVEYVQAGDVSIAQAIGIAVDILFWNSNRLYKLDEERQYPQLARACGRPVRDSVQPQAESTLATDSVDSRATTRAVSKSLTAETLTPLVDTSLQDSAITNAMAKTLESDVKAFDAFHAKNPSVKYIWITNVDYTGTPRMRMIPVAAFRKHLSSGKYPGITTALPRLLQNDTVAAGSCPTGEIQMVPDLSSMRLNGVIKSPSASVQAWWMEDNGGIPDEHYFACPRWALQKHLKALEDEFRLTMLMGFEVEIIFMRPKLNSDKSEFEAFEPLNTAHCWSHLTYQDMDLLPMVEEIIETLAGLGIELNQFHTEAAPGQWEFPLPCFEPLKAIDVLYKARETIRWVAQKHGLKATLYPRPFSFTCGSASHTHFSINGTASQVAKCTDPFLAGILAHLPSILAFTLPIEESYARVAAGIWAGGEWVCWGTQNREVPLRKCGPGHWELKTVDGIGNMYLSMAALVAAGLAGLRAHLPLTCRDNPDDASVVSDQRRHELGITTKLPKSLTESLDRLGKDLVLREYLGTDLVDLYIDTKRFEMETLNKMDEHKRKTWLIARY